MTGEEMVEWHYRFNGHEFGLTPGDDEGQGGLACCSPQGHKESDTTEQQQHRSNYSTDSTVNNIYKITIPVKAMC